MSPSSHLLHVWQNPVHWPWSNQHCQRPSHLTMYREMLSPSRTNLSATILASVERLSRIPLSCSSSSGEYPAELPPSTTFSGRHPRHSTTSDGFWPISGISPSLGRPTTIGRRMDSSAFADSVVVTLQQVQSGFDHGFNCPAGEETPVHHHAWILVVASKASMTTFLANP